MPHLVRRVRAQHIQWWRDQLGLDRDSLVTLLLTRPQRLFDRVNPSRCITRQLDVRAEFNWLGGQPPSDRARERTDGSWTGRIRERGKDCFLFATPTRCQHARMYEVGHSRESQLECVVWMSVSLPKRPSDLFVELLQARFLARPTRHFLCCRSFFFSRSASHISGRYL